MNKTVGIAGAGLLGRLLAFQLAWAGYQVTLFDSDDRRGRRGCSYAGAGMLAPYAELEHAEALICRLGCRSMSLWPGLFQKLALPVFFQQEGSLVVAHRPDWSELDAFRARVLNKLPATEAMVSLDTAGIASLEPELGDRFSRGFFFPGEGQLDPRLLLDALAHALLRLGVTWFDRTSLDEVAPGHVAAGSRNWRFQWVIDARGLGAKPELHQLRGVRGELLRLRAPEVNLRRPVRLMHPRYPLYIVPRPEHLYLIGATSVECEDFSPISVKAVLELLSAAYSLHPGFAEARLLESTVQCRPALPHHLPAIFPSDGLIRVNGLYRHGFLIAPAVVDEVIGHLAHKPPGYPQLWERDHVEAHG